MLLAFLLKATKCFNIISTAHNAGKKFFKDMKIHFNINIIEYCSPVTTCEKAGVTAALQHCSAVLHLAAAAHLQLMTAKTRKTPLFLFSCLPNCN